MLVFEDDNGTVSVIRGFNVIGRLHKHAPGEWVLYNMWQIADFPANDLRQIAAKLDELNAKGDKEEGTNDLQAAMFHEKLISD